MSRTSFGAKCGQRWSEAMAFHKVCGVVLQLFSSAAVAPHPKPTRFVGASVVVGEVRSIGDQLELNLRAKPPWMSPDACEW
ncbi:MAG: hypothetical protein FWD57_12955 [Polyangiaceae bacterium]|nr:hypothetical protein [Polyangiaceae bacterium]